MKIKPIQALAVIKRHKPLLNANGIFHKADRKFIIVSTSELLIDVTITPIEKKPIKTEITDEEIKKAVKVLKSAKPAKYLHELMHKGTKAPKKKVAKPAKKGAR